MLTIFMIANQSCSEFEPSSPPEDQLLDGPMEGLTYAQRIQFVAGDEAFSVVFTRETGLGPLFVTTGCATCHLGDGKGHPFSTLKRFGQVDNTGNQFLQFGGPQLQNRALPGYAPEKIPDGATFSKFTPPSVTGLGFLEAVTDEDILLMSDSDDEDGDGISGVPNWIDLPQYITPSQDVTTNGGKYIGRFGKKASVYNLLHQTVNAYNQDIGITSTFDPVDTYSGLSQDPEVSDITIRNVVAYLQTLKTPIQRTPLDADVVDGAEIFIQIRCENCHKQTLTAGDSPIELISNKEFHPYSDLLLHDMGPGLDDGYTEGSAETYEWRTPPLWGLGLSPNSQGDEYFLLHDGRARSIEEAIQYHGGEAASSQIQFNALTEKDKKALIKFLKSL